MMKQIDKRFLIASVAATLAAMLAAASLLTGCGENSEGTDETKVITETQIVTRVVNGVYTDEDGNILRDKDGEPLTAPSGTPDSDTKEKSGSSKSSDSKSDEKSESGNSGEKSDEKSEKKSESSSSGEKSEKKSESSKSDEKSESSKSEKKGSGESGGTLKLGGKTFNVGDTVTCTYSVTSPDAFINYQATLNYDDSVLQATGAKMAGDASSGSVVNYKLDGKVKFNGINLGGYDYVDGGKFMTVTYEVVGTGSADPEIDWEIVTDDDNKPMVVNGELRSSFKVSESYE